MARYSLRFVAGVVGPRCRQVVEKGRPDSDVDLNALGVLVVPEERLQVFPAVEAADLAKGGVDDAGEGFGLPVAPDGMFNI
jgi:hypothetical protein